MRCMSNLFLHPLIEGPELPQTVYPFASSLKPENSPCCLTMCLILLTAASVTMRKKSAMLNGKVDEVLSAWLRISHLSQKEKLF